MVPIDERSKAKYQPWNEEGFSSDIKVNRMTQLQRWMYRTLLQRAFVCSTRPRLPDDDEELWQLADCKDLKQWQANKDKILAMFERATINVPVLTNRRLEEDWSRILDIREERSKAGKEGAKQRLANAKQKLATVSKSPAKSSNEMKGNEIELNEGEGKEEDPDPIPDFEDEDTDMKAEKAIAASCVILLGVKAETYPDVIEQIKSRARATSNGQVLREFEEWAVENQGDDFRGKPLSAWLRSYTSGRIEQKQATENPVIKAIGREIAYRSKGQMVLEPKHKAGLLVAVEEENYTFDEVMAAYSEFFQKMDKDNAKNLEFAAGNFVKQAPDLLYAIRRQRQEKDLEASAVAQAAARMQEEAEAERKARREKQAEEEALIEDELGD